MATAAWSAAASGTFVIGGDLPSHRLGFGAMRITGEGIWGPPKDVEEARRVLRRCLELGINFIDTADSYGPGVSEELIGETLTPYAEGLVIATKGGLTRQGPDKWAPVGRPEDLRQQLELSLRRLRVERIDSYQLHRIGPRAPMEESLGAIQEFQREGRRRGGATAAQLSIAWLLHRSPAMLPIPGTSSVAHLEAHEWRQLEKEAARQ